MVVYTVARHDPSSLEFWSGAIGLFALVLSFQLELWNRVKNERQAVATVCGKDAGEKSLHESVQGEVEDGD
jgi:hypothetical protein